MKFPQLPIGARFEYEGRVYVKVGPLAASSEDGGGQRIIPRFAVLKPVGEGGVEAAAPRSARQLDEAAVLAAFEAYHRDCRQLLHTAGSDVDRRGQALAELDAARGRFLEALGA